MGVAGDGECDKKEGGSKGRQLLVQECDAWKVMQMRSGGGKEEDFLKKILRSRP